MHPLWINVNKWDAYSFFGQVMEILSHINKSACAKCGDLESAVKLFEEMPRRNTVSWSCMIAAYTQANQPGEAVRMFILLKL
jgi:pentatricopeptide repeat protein